jgi:phosphatidate phosphatase APP1
VDRGWRRVLGQIVAAADGASDRARQRLRQRRPTRRALLVVPYVGFGTRERLCISGRVLEDAGFAEANASDSGWRNLVQLGKRLQSDEVPGARVTVRLGDTERVVTTDGEGYFAAELEPADALAADGWHTATVALPDVDAPPAEVQVLVPAASARFGIVSDLDDTVVQTHVTRRVKMLVELARRNARTRKPFPGVAAFYRALHHGAGGDERNPLFYVSSSPWNLYTPLVEFLSVQDIPLGPLLLRDFGDHTVFGSGAGHGHHGHKRAAIERLLQTYPDLPFVLIGDSGEQDPEIYSSVVRDHPRRIVAIYIRAVHSDPARTAAIDALIAAAEPTSAQLVVVQDSDMAAAHAAAAGLTSAGERAPVRAETARDEGG